MRYVVGRTAFLCVLYVDFVGANCSVLVIPVLVKRRARRYGIPYACVSTGDPGSSPG